MGEFQRSKTGKLEYQGSDPPVIQCEGTMQVPLIGLCSRGVKGEPGAEVLMVEVALRGGGSWTVGVPLVPSDPPEGDVIYMQHEAIAGALVRAIAEAARGEIVEIAPPGGVN